MKYRKKPVVIEAVQWVGSIESLNEIRSFMSPYPICPKLPQEDESPILLIRTLEGTHEASPGDFIIKGVQGEFYPCKPDIFEATYEAVKD